MLNVKEVIVGDKQGKRWVLYSTRRKKKRCRPCPDGVYMDFVSIHYDNGMGSFFPPDRRADCLLALKEAGITDLPIPPVGPR